MEKIELKKLNTHHTPRTSQKGITLIALVITIIVLLILAGVAINLAVDANGLFSKANEAKTEWNNRVEQEGETIQNVLDLAEEYLGGGGGSGGQGQQSDASGANIPVIPTGDMKVEYVTWTENNGTWEETLSTTKPENWHNYNEKQWANIKTTSKTPNDDGSYNEAYWVWIPRFAYQVPEKPTSENNSGGVEFQIAFLEGATNTPVDASVLGGKTIGTTPTVGEWVVHPAFDFGGTPLKGIWVAKYEASSSNPSATSGGGDELSLQVNVVGGVASWRNIRVSTIFSVCQNMKESKGALEGSTNADPHMIKNSEWGAVVYLSQSHYGKNEEVWNNPNSSYLTGQAGPSKDSYYGDGTSPYNSGNGPEASTTGNVTGVYDMVGGSQEYVAAYVDNRYAQSSTYITNLRNAEAKYKDVYTASSKDPDSYDDEDDNWEEIAQANYEVNSSLYGDAVFETSYCGIGDSSWFRDASCFPHVEWFVFMRGGERDTAKRGLFFFSGDYGDGSGSDGSNYTFSFRPVCVGL